MFSAIAFFIFIGQVYADTTKEKVIFSGCVDGDTAKFVINNEVKTVRFLAIDTPETVHPTKEVEAYGVDASTYTCNKLKNAKEVVLEYESSNKTDKYGRILAWIWVDDTLLQDELIKQGYAEVAYIYGNYKYTDLLKDHEATAQSNLVGIWGNNEKTEDDKEEVCKEDCHNSDTINENWITIVLLACLIIIFILNPTYRKKKTKQIKKKIKKKIDKEIDNLIK